MSAAAGKSRPFLSRLLIFELRIYEVVMALFFRPFSLGRARRKKGVMMTKKMTTVQKGEGGKIGARHKKSPTR